MSQAATLNGLELPDEDAATQAARAVEDLTAFLRAHPTPTTRLRLCPEDTSNETSLLIPAVAFRFFVEVLAQLANGNAVTVAPVHAELTTQQAADLLNVSRTYLIGLLDSGKIPFRRTGNRRKVRLADLLDYKFSDDQRRQAILNELTREAEDLGILGWPGRKPCGGWRLRNRTAMPLVPASAHFLSGHLARHRIPSSRSAAQSMP